MAGSMDVIEFVAREALTNEDKFKRLVAQLGDSSRRNRQNAAGSLAFIAKVSPPSCSFPMHPIWSML